MIKIFFQAVDNRQYRAMAFERGDTRRRGLLSPRLLLAVFPGLIVGNGNPGKSSRSPEFGRWRWELLKAQAAGAERREVPRAGAPEISTLTTS